MKFEKTEVFNFEGAIRGARNPMNSWAKSDSSWMIGCAPDTNCEACLYKPCNLEAEKYYNIGPKDMDLLIRLIRSGPEHRKFLRQIMVSVDITAPLYIWKEYDTYKVGTVANSTSTMHKIQAKEFTRDDFACNMLVPHSLEVLDKTIEELNFWRDIYNNGGMVVYPDVTVTYKPKDKEAWYQMIQLLPSSYEQKRTCTMTYENLHAICSPGQRRNHKLYEWSLDFMNWARSLPYAQELLFTDEIKE